MMSYVLNFPKSYKILRYGGLHYHFFICYLRLSQNLKIEVVEDNDKVFCDGSVFSCTLNEKQFYVDISDSDMSFWKKNNPEVPYFKYQKTDKSQERFMPLGPPICASFDRKKTESNIKRYFEVRDSFIFSPQDNILCKQRPYGNAVERRNTVKRFLSRNFKNLDLNYKMSDCMEFWESNRNALTSICVPGNRNTMIDRGQLELMGLGVCTISPELDTFLCHNQKPIPDVHYIKCSEDYSNLGEKIKMLQKDKKLSKQIGDNARDFFDTYYKPDKYLEWIIKRL